jgi:hypothetical protein
VRRDHQPGAGDDERLLDRLRQIAANPRGDDEACADDEHAPDCPSRAASQAADHDRCSADQERCNEECKLGTLGREDASDLRRCRKSWCGYTMERTGNRATAIPARSTTSIDESTLAY